MHRLFAFLMAIGVTILTAACGQRRPANVLVVTIDTLRADHLGSYGYAAARTPNLDRLAGEGVRCANAIAAAPITMPAHTSIFTGLLPPAHGVRDNGAYAVGDSAVTLAERLRAAGFTTHAFVSALVLNRRYNLNQGFESYDDDLWSEDEPPLFMIRERQAPKTADRFLKWLASWRSQSSRKPFFAWIHFFDPHQPYKAPSTMGATPYDAEIALVDQQLGRIVDQLHEDGLLDDTLLVITADHGESLGEHGEKTHAVFVYDATVHVPLIWRYPRLLRPSVYAAPVRSVDITPTILSILGLAPLQKGDGRDLTSALRGREELQPLPQYSESLLSETGFGMAPLFAVRDGGYKYIRAPRPELYDLRSDPHELKNLYAKDSSIARHLDSELSGILRTSAAHAIRADVTPLTGEDQETLQALGYLAPKSERTSMSGLDPKDGLPIYNKLEDARHFAQSGDWQSSRRLLGEMLASNPRNISALNVLGYVAVKEGDRAAAVDAYRKSLAVDPTQFRVYQTLGAIAMSEGSLDEAAAHYRQALSLNPHNVDAMASLGFLAAVRGDENTAEKWYAQGVTVDPTSPRLHRRIGDLYYEKGDFARALVSYRKVIDLTPSDLRAVLQAGNCERRLGHPSEAERYFRRAEALRPDAWVPLYNRACLAVVSGRVDDGYRLLASLASRHQLQRELIESDPDLAPLRARPEFAKLQLQAIAGDVADPNPAG